MPRLKRIEAPKKFVELLNAGIERGDEGFCSVTAVSVAAGISFDESSKLLEAHGRKKGHGFSGATWNTRKIMEGLGFTVTDIRLRHFIRRYPGAHKNLKHPTTHHPRRFNNVWKDGHTYIILTPNHMCTVIDGQMIDWSVNRSLKIVGIMRIEKAPDLDHDAHVIAWEKRPKPHTYFSIFRTIS